MGLYICFRNLIVGNLLLYCMTMEVFSYPAHSKGNAASKPKYTGRAFEDANYWRTTATATLAQKLKEDRKIGVAKNVIFYLGDGWDVQTFTAARVLKGQKVDHVKFGEEAKFYMESFPSTGFSKTYCVDSQVADSACTATAYLGGVKTNYETIGVTPNVLYNNCSAQQIPANHVSSILAWAQAAGKSTGLVTTTAITDASPAGAYAHVACRYYQGDADVLNYGQDPNTCDDIAEQLILHEPGKNVDVILAGGREKFLPVSATDSEGFPGQRLDGKNLIKTWKSIHTANGTNAVYVENVKDLEKVDPRKTDKLMGLFAPLHIGYFDEQQAMGDPRLLQMTEKAIKILSKNPSGFFLFVEGGRIDHAHHDNYGQRALWETIEFDRAIQKGDEMTSDDDTLIVVTADHGHVMTIAGYPHRGNDIMGIADFGDDGLPYSTIGYQNGPAWKPFVNGQRYNISKDDLDNISTQQVPFVPLFEETETHGGQDVQILAKGPFAHLLSGVFEQNYIPYVMAYASCVGNELKYCSENGSSNAHAQVG